MATRESGIFGSAPRCSIQQNLKSSNQQISKSWAMYMRSQGIKLPSTHKIIIEVHSRQLEISACHACVRINAYGTHFHSIVKTSDTTQRFTQPREIISLKS